MRYIALILFVSFISSQISKNSDLFIVLKKQDSLLFELGFNQCNYKYLEKIIHKDLKFYHDQSGIQDRKIFFENTKKYVCSNQNKKPIRKLEENSLKVFPLYKNGNLYGAIQHGIHNFYIREKEKKDIHTSTARFTHLYLLENKQWHLKEVFSYDHKSP